MTQYKVWECQVCAWIYDEAKGWPEDGIAPGTRWEDIPNDWLCPECGVGKDDFDMVAISQSTVETEPRVAPPAVATESKEYSIWECQVCAWIYDESKGWPEDGIAPGTKWQDIPSDWLCPECGVGKADFEMVEVKRVQVATKVQSSEPAEYKAEKPTAPVRVDSSRQPVVIIGSGLAGYNLAKEIRKTDKQVPISVFTADDGAFYSKPMLSTGFAKNKTAADLASHSAEQMAEQYDLDVHIYTRISAIDSDNKTITCDDDKAYNYGKLVFAIGARCIQAPVSGNGLSHVYSVNDLLDYNRFRTLAKSKRKVLIIGAGLIGCEYANDLLQSGFEVNVVDAMPTALANLLPEQASQSLVNAMTDAGAAFHFDTVVETISKQDNGVLATLSNGNSIAADIVLSAIGVRPNLGLATTTGLEVNRGIKTDRHMQTSVADIYAVGDCAEVEGHVLFYIAPLMAQVKALAATLTGTPTKVHYPAMPVAIKTTLFPVVVNPPQAGADGQWHDKINRSTGVQSHFVDAQGQLLGFALTGDQVSQRAELETQCPALLS